MDISIRLDDPDTRIQEPGAHLRSLVVGRSLIRRGESFPGGEGFRATVELHLAAPTN